MNYPPLLPISSLLCISLPLRCSHTESPLFISKPWMAPLGLEPWYSKVREEGSMACSLSPPPSMSCSSRDWGKPNMKRADTKSKAPQRRKPPHQAPIQRGSSGVMSSVPGKEMWESFTVVNGDEEYYHHFKRKTSQVTFTRTTRATLNMFLHGISFYSLSQ